MISELEYFIDILLLVEENIKIFEDIFNVIKSESIWHHNKDINKVIIYNEIKLIFSTYTYWWPGDLTDIINELSFISNIDNHFVDFRWFYSYKFEFNDFKEKFMLVNNLNNYSKIVKQFSHLKYRSTVAIMFGTIASIFIYNKLYK